MKEPLLVCAAPAARTVSADPGRVASRLLDPERSPLASTFWASQLLLESLEGGQNIDRLAARLRVSRNFVARCARRLLDGGVWQNGQTVCEWRQERQAHPAFWMDVAVAEGKLARRIGVEGELEWAVPGTWSKPFDYRVSDAAEADNEPSVRFSIPLPVPSVAAAEATEPWSAEWRSRQARPRTAGGSRSKNTSHVASEDQPNQDVLCALFPDAAWIR